jgi:hypothetical protein
MAEKTDPRESVTFFDKDGWPTDDREKAASAEIDGINPRGEREHVFMLPDRRPAPAAE